MRLKSEEKGTDMATPQQMKQLLIAKVESLGIKYDDLSDAQLQRISFGWNTKVISGIRVNVYFDEDGDSIHLSTMLPITIPEEKLAQALVEVNNWNKRLRWIDLYLDDDRTIMGEMDAVIEPSTAGDEIVELLMRTLSICDDVYPTFARLVWA